MPEKPTYEELKKRIQELKRAKSKHKQVKEALHESEERYRTFFKNNHSVILIINPETADIVDANPAAILYYGWTHGEITSKKITDINTLSEEQIFQEMEKANQENRRNFYFHHRLANDDIRDVDVYSGPIELYGKKHLLSIIHDITERKRVEEALQRSEKKHTSLIKNIPGMVYSVFPDWSVDIVSGCEKISGYSDAELNSKEINWLSTIHPDDIERVFNKGSVLSPKQKDLVQSYRIFTKDGNVRWVEDHKTSLFSEDGGFLGIDGIVFNITEQKLAEEALQKSEDNYQKIFDQTAVGIAYSDFEGNFLRINQRFCQILGYPREELLNLSIPDISHPQDLKEERKLVEKIIAGDSNIHFMEKRFIRKNGAEMWGKVTVALERNSDGEPKYFIGVLQDITERKRIEGELQKAYDKLEQRVKERTNELEVQKNRLEETNVALNILLEKRLDDKSLMQEQVLSNVNKLVIPYIEKIKNSRLNDLQKALIYAIDSGLQEISSPFSLKLSSEAFGLTPTEIIVADLIKHGKGSKEIADIRNLSPKTIERHRENIRSKLGIKNKKVNLQSHLNSLT